MEGLELRSITSYTSRISTINVSHSDSNTISLRSDTSESSSSTEEYFPEGGFSAWLVVVGSFIGLVADFGLINSIGSIQAYISQNQLASDAPSTTSWIFALFVAMSYIGGIFGGVIFDEYGTKIPMLLGILLFTGGLFATANCTKVYQFVLAFGFMTGIGAALCLNPLMGVISHWFKKKRAQATGLCSLGGSVGGIVFPIMLRNLYEQIGFVWAIRVLAFISLMCLLAAFFLIKERIPSVTPPPPPPQQQQQQQQQQSQRKGPDVAKIWSLVRNSIEFSLLKDPKFLFLVLASLLGELSLVNMLTYFSTYALSVGVSETNAYLMMTVLNLLGIFGRAIPGFLADRYGPFNLTCIMNALVPVLELVIWLPFGSSEKVLWGYVAVFGFFSASVLSLTPVVVSAISPTRDFGKRYATNCLFTGITTFASLPIAGVIINNGTLREYNNFIIFTGMMAVFSDICWLCCRYCIVGRRVNVRV